MTAAVAITADATAIRAHLDLLFSPAEEAYPDGLIEICYGPDKPSQAQHFFVTENGRKLAADFAARINDMGQNVYVGANPRKPGTPAGRAGAAHVDIAFFHFADLDDPTAVKRARENMPIRPNAVVITGTAPENRPHFYWKLEEPVTNLQAWSERQRAIAGVLHGDAVIDPPRIMRLAGTVNYPPPHKVERGYRVERSSFAAYDRPLVTPEAVDKAFPRQESNVVPIRAEGTTTLAAMRQVSVGDLIAACQAGDQWHNTMIRLVGHLVHNGRSDAEIMALSHAITLPGYSVDQTAREMMTALQGGRRKWDIPQPLDSVTAEEAAREEADSVFDLLDMDQLEALPPPTWLIDELIADHGLSIVYGDPGAGKSFVVLDMALRLAYGMDWHGTAAAQTGVLYIAGEGSRGLGKRIKGWRREHAMEGADAPFLLLPVAVQMLDDKERGKLLRTIDAAMSRAGFAIGLVVIDTVSRALAGQDENGQEAMSLFVRGCSQIQDHTGGAVIGVHHSGKDKEKGMRGSTVLLGACDASLKLTKGEQNRVTIKVEKQKDAEEATDIHMEMRKTEWVIGLGKEESTLVPFKAEKRLIAEKKLSRKDADAIFDAVDLAWAKGNPFAISPQSSAKGRRLQDYISREYEVTRDHADSMVRGWLEREYMALEQFSRSSRATGLRVLKRLEQDK